MITLLLYAFSYVSGTPIPGNVYWFTGLFDGFVIGPLMTLAAVPYMGRITREKIGRLHYLQAVAPMETIVLILTPWGYEFAPVDMDDEGQRFAVLKGGHRVELNLGGTWYKLANRRFGVTYIPSTDVLGERLADPDEIELETIPVRNEDGSIQQRQVVSGGRGLLKKKRGGFRGYTPYPKGDPDGLLISLSRAINSLRGGGDVRISERTEMSTRMEYGAGTQMSNKTRAIASVATILLASGVGVLIFGVLG